MTGAAASGAAAPAELRRLGIVGAGTMGAGIAALAASAGVPVELLDVPGDGDDRDAVARRGIERQLQARPPAFADPSDAERIRAGNIDDHLDRLAACDWVIEAIVEDADAKRALYNRLDAVLGPAAAVTSNTSSIRMGTLLEGRPRSFCRRFLGTHFFNPPRYLHLLELIPTEDTDPAVFEFVRQSGERVLGKGTVIARDTPGFIANRIGVFGLVHAIRLSDELGLGVDDVDALTGELIGRPRSATFRTIDLTGLDVLAAVAAELGAATGEDFALPDWVHGMIREGRLGAKTGKGFFHRLPDGRILAVDPAVGGYRERRPVEADLGALAELPILERVERARALADPHGVFLRRLLDDTAAYARHLAPEIAHDPLDVDRAMRWGFGWQVGPLGTGAEGAAVPAR